VTNEDYLQYLEATRMLHRRPVHWNQRRPFFRSCDARQAVVNVAWDDALAWCDWAGYRMPAPADLAAVAPVMPEGPCTFAWVAAGTGTHKQTIENERWSAGPVRPRDSRSLTLGILYARVPIVESGLWAVFDSGGSVPPLHLPSLRSLVEHHRVSRVHSAPSMRFAATSHTVRPFSIASDCVTNKQYWEFVRSDASRYPRHWSPEHRVRSEWPFPVRLADCPVVNVTYEQASAFARSFGFRLPTLIERRFAVQSSAGALYPWSGPFDSSRCNSLETDRGELVRVDEYAAGTSIQGCRQLSGNNWEWAVGTEGQRVLCGGSFAHPCAFWGAAASYSELRTGIPIDPSLIGFRLVRA
jgi:formylglycine-generating enzyme required for sulfatase activity